jgi:flagellar biosynthetic protein FliO
MFNPFDRFSSDPRLKKIFPVLIVVLVIILFGAFVWAAFATKTTAANPQDAGGMYADPTSITVNVVFRLLFVLAIIYLCYGLYRWMQNKKVIQQPKKRLAVIESVRISPRQAVHIIRVGSQEFLVGATDQAMNLISEVESAPVEESAVVIDKPATIPAAGFEQLFQQSIKDSLNLFRGNKNDHS